jgi:TonB-dependent receptor-like protein/carboxypeptidase family protein
VIVLICCVAAVASAQPLSVRGRVVDARGKPVRGAVVTIDDKTAITDAQGRYAIAGAPPGSDVIVSRDGYAPALAQAAASVDDIVLVADSAETIEVHGEPPPAAQGAAHVEREDLERLPGTGNDLVRALSAMPGVASYPFPIGSSGVVIRGSSAQDSKILIDDFEVPELYHDVGFRSIVPAEAIDSLDYVPGGFDVAFGRATSGIVQLTTRGGDDKTAQQAEISGIDGGALARGSAGRGRYMIAFRRSTIDAILPLVLPGDLDLSLTTVPRYYDAQLRFDYKLGEHWNLRASSLGADDALEVYASRDQNADKRFANRTRFVRTTVAARYHDGPWAGQLALSGIVQDMSFERGIYQHLDVTAPALTLRGELTRSARTLDGLSDVVWRLGGEATATHYSVDAALPGDRRDGEPLAPDDPMNTELSFDGTVRTDDLAAWTAVAASLDEHVRATVGVRVDAFTHVADVAVQPRAELAVKLTPAIDARVSAGAYSRPPEYQSELLATGISGERSTQVIGGVGYRPVEGVRLQGSLYYTDRNHLITHDDAGMLSNSGRGTTYGAELLGTAHVGPWFGWLAYAYSHSTRVDTPGGDRRLFDFDQPHVLNVAASYRWHAWQFGARFRLSSGMPITPVEGAIFDSDKNLYYPKFGAVNSERAPLHHQLDLRVDKSWHWGPVKMTKFLDIQNVYLNDSVVTYFYGFDYTQRAAFHSLPILPTAGLRGEW